MDAVADFALLESGAMELDWQIPAVPIGSKFKLSSSFHHRSTTEQNQSNSPRYNSPSSTQEAETPSPKSTQPHQPLPETTRLVNGTSTESESRTGAVVVAAARGLVSLVLADPVSVAGVVAASRNGGSSTNPSVRAEARVLVSSENTNEVLESGDKGKSEESVVAERDGGDAAARGRTIPPLPTYPTATANAPQCPPSRGRPSMRQKFPHRRGQVWKP
ncbi:hypothetical protein DEO72_LG8g1923 [Vigna unguiculata]|uniref:Uncharacterized protein n=1 Tax=Vigna unguiculata TaxID=3917 RepID=A0A4D6MR39_VIGUN|nr:hypothetical protein DEO72_LG8g1923 [Vigna unguiculata]